MNKIELEVPEGYEIDLTSSHRGTLRRPDYFSSGEVFQERCLLVINKAYEESTVTA